MTDEELIKKSEEAIKKTEEAIRITQEALKKLSNLTPKMIKFVTRKPIIIKTSPKPKGISIRLPKNPKIKIK